MKIFYDNKIDELKKIIEAKAKYQKVMLLFDDSVSNLSVREIYELIKTDCVYNQSHISEIETDEIYNGYKLIIFMCETQSYLKCNIDTSEFINVFMPVDECFLPYFLNYELKLKHEDNYLFVNNKSVDWQILSSIAFNDFYNYFKSIHSGKDFKISLKNNLITNQNVFDYLNRLDEDCFFVDVDIIKKCNLSYKDLILVDLMLIDAFLLLITSLKNQTYMLVDVYKVAKNDDKLIEKLYRFFNNETFRNIITLNYNCLYNYCLKTKYKIIEYISYCNIDNEKIDYILKKIKAYAKDDNELIGYLYLFNIFNS